MKIRERKLLYHQTKLANLESIAANGLLSRAALRENNMAFQDVADGQILAGRHELDLENYVPFHFHWRTTFDYRVRFDHPNDEFIYLCMQREKAKALGAKILPAHPLCNLAIQLYSYDEGMEVIRWDDMEKDRPEDEAERNIWNQIRMAECLIENKVEMADILKVITNSEETADAVRRILENYQDIFVDVRTDMFFMPGNQPE